MEYKVSRTVVERQAEDDQHLRKVDVVSRIQPLDGYDIWSVSSSER